MLLVTARCQKWHAQKIEAQLEAEVKERLARGRLPIKSRWPRA